MKESLQRRAQSVGSRAAVRAWEYRQRHHAKGSWYALRRLLAAASHAYALSEPSAQELLSEGARPEPAGERLEPPKTILFVPAPRLELVPDKKPLPVRLGAELLAARFIALVRFD